MLILVLHLYITAIYQVKGHRVTFYSLTNARTLIEKKKCSFFSLKPPLIVNLQALFLQMFFHIEHRGIHNKTLQTHRLKG